MEIYKVLLTIKGSQKFETPSHFNAQKRKTTLRGKQIICTETSI
jgi:hypothetical protein